ncbi:ABC transporter permease [Tritonibacter mobilis]|uniref:ABC transporter permease n=1 Tax=Tritonibacter mobilis TaxID=379347 RepID=UPI000806CABB|nr:FtsX-like permease family protein [Tritonibacter mobilis]
MKHALYCFLSHWRRAPLQLLLLIAGLALATALWSAVQAINSEARASYARAVEQLGAAQLTALTSPEGTIPVETYVRLRRSGWQVSPVLEGTWQVDQNALTLLGVDALSYPGAPAMFQAASARGLDLSDVLTPPGWIFAHPTTLPDLMAFERTIPLPQVPPRVVLADLSLAERLLDQPGQLSRILILPDQPQGLPPLAEIVPELRQSQNPDGALADPQRLTRSFHLNLTAFGFLSFCVGLFIVQGSVTLGIEQRRGTIRTLRCLGVSTATLIQALFLELLILALVSGVLGLVIGYALAALLLPDVSATLRGLYGAPVEGSLTLRPTWVISGLVMTSLGTGAAGAQAFVALRRMANALSRSPVASARMTWRSQRVFLGASAVLIAAGYLALKLVPGLIGGFAFLGGTLLGAALLLPPILFAVTSALQGALRAPLWRWLVADSRLQLPGISLSLMALLLAVATNIGVGTMVSSFRLTFLDWIEQRLPADAYVEVTSATTANQIMEWAMQNDARALPQYRIDSRTASAPLRIYGIIDDPLYRTHWPLLEAEARVWDQIYDEGAVLISEQLARREGLQTGDQIALTPDWTTQIAGIYPDYGNPDGQAVVALSTLQARASGITVSRVGVVAPPDVSTADLMQQLRQDLNLTSDNVVEAGMIQRASVAIFDRTFVVTGALNILTLGVAGFALLTSFLSQWSKRLPHLAPVWAMGITRTQLARLELTRSLTFAVVTFVLALPLGFLLAWALLAVINVEAFGWRLPMYLFPMECGRLFAMTLVVAALASLLPALRLMRMSPATLLGVFASDR